MLSNLKIIDQKSIDLATDIIFRQKINKKIDQYYCLKQITQSSNGGFQGPKHHLVGFQIWLNLNLKQKGYFRLRK